MLSRSEGHFQGHNGIKLYFQRWKPTTPRASLVITPGHGEHSGSYTRLVEALKDFSIDIFAWDVRGHGKSEGLRGYAQDFSDYAKDYELFLAMLTTEKGILSRPLFLLGHSMGALIQELVLCNHPQLPITAQILASPMFGIAVAIPPYKATAAKYLNILLPKVTLWNEIPDTYLSRDTDVIREYELDSLRHDRMSAGAYLGSVSAMSEIASKASRIQIPTLMLLAEKDPVTSTESAKEIYEKLSSESKCLKVYADRKHELFNDLGRDQVFADLKDFLTQYLR